LTEPPEDGVSRYLRTQAREDFDAMAKHWLPSIRRFLVVHLGPDLEACDEVQQAVLIALTRDLAGFKGGSMFSTFLYRLVRNKAVDHIRSQGRHRRHNRRLDDIDPASPLLGAGDPLEALVRENTADRLAALLGTLPPRDRELVHLREVEGLGEKECAVLLGQPVGTLKSRLHRIKRKLYLKMTEGGGS